MEIAVNRKLYEGMFLVDSAQATDWDATKLILEDVLKRANAEIVEMKKWDERKLAYEVKGKGRGTYILCYFIADCEKIQDIEKAVQLSEQVMRVLILSTEQMTAEDMQKDTPVARAEKEAAAEEAEVVGAADMEELATEAETVEEDAKPDINEEPQEVKERVEAETSDERDALAETESEEPKEQDLQ